MKPGVIITIFAVGFVLVRPAFYSVTEADQVVITRFGKPIGKAITKPGLQFKIPFIDQVNRFDKRYLAWDGDANQMVTADKKRRMPDATQLISAIIIFECTCCAEF